MENPKQKTIDQLTDLELADNLQQRYEQMFRLQGELALLDGEKKKRMILTQQNKEIIEPTTSIKEADNGKV